MKSITQEPKKLLLAVTSAVIIAGGTQAAFAPTVKNQCHVTFDFAKGPLSVDSHGVEPLCSAYDVAVDALEELSSSSAKNSIPSPSLVNQPFDLIGDGVSDEQREFELKLGKAMDTLRQDYPDMLTSDPDFSIYSPEIEVVDPSGVTLNGLTSYKTSFSFLHTIAKFFYCPEKSCLTFRLIYDCARRNIRVSWNAILVPRALYGGIKHQLHVDGISVYELDRQSGLIYQHRVEHLLVNDLPVQAPQGIFSVIQNQAMEGPEGIPVLNLEKGGNMQIMEFKGNNLLGIGSRLGGTSLFSVENKDGGVSETSLFDQEAFERKNASRRKFGLPPITQDEFIRIEAETRKLEIQQQQKAAASSSAAEMTKPKEKGSFMKLFGNILQDSCESNFDCERPQVCCDLGFKKMCCSSGMGVYNGAPGQPIPVRVVADDGMQQGGPGGMDNYN